MSKESEVKKLKKQVVELNEKISQIESQVEERHKEQMAAQVTCSIILNSNHSGPE